MSRLRSTFVVYAVATGLMAIAFLLLWHFAPTLRAPIVMFHVFGCLLIAMAVLGFIAKAIPTKNGIARPEERPFQYWSHVIGYMLIGVVLIVLGFTQNW
jgi:hypothetical protein